MKKLLIAVLLLTTIFLSGCKSTEVEEFDFIDIYYLNDFHGAITSSGDDIGLSGIGNYIAKQEELYPNNVVVLAGGDMLQGSALSNYYDGLSTIDIMDSIGFDSLTLGNHEFDWGLDTVTQYFDDNEANGEADFPLLGANVFLEGTTTIPDNIDPYTIITKGDVKIGVIGTMGYGLEYSIATSLIDGYEFAYPVPIIEQYATELRTVENCDIVVWVGHDSGDYNSEIKALTGDAKIDALFNAHSHRDFIDDTSGAPILQSGSTGEFLGHIRINLDEENNIETYKVENLSLYTSALFFDDYGPAKTLIDAYKAETDPLFNVELLKAGQNMTQSSLSDWIAELMRVATGSDIGFQNYGGTRTDIDSSESITLGKLYEIWPFDNVVKTVYLKGSVINNLKSSGYAHSSTITFEANTLYKVATNDYTFDKEENPFINGVDIENTGIVLRDLANDELLLQSVIYTDFKVSNTMQTENLTN